MATDTAPVAGLHHVTAIAAAPAANLAFYTGPMGLRMVKKTVNFDDPGTYHLYYGDRTGSPGTILTFFPYPDAIRGRVGPGQAQAWAHVVPEATMDAMIARLTEAGHAPLAQGERFGARVVTLTDPHGQLFELVADPDAKEWTGAFHSVTLWVDDPEPTARVLTDLLGYRSVAEADEPGGGRRLRLAAQGAAGGKAPGKLVDVLRRDGSTPGRQGAGIIHHIAFRARDDAHQADLREAVLSAGHGVTPPIDRQYFNAIYFREPGGVLFEIATDPPGFLIDEDEAELGHNLRLPAQHEPLRQRIEAMLPSLAPSD